MRRLKSLVGEKFGKWTVLKEERKNTHRICLCKCDCGKIKEVSKGSLVAKKSLSCGCSKRDKKHYSKTRLYKIYIGIKTRCYNVNRENYYRYGGRGIIMCEEWKNDFMSFYNWSMDNGYKENLTIDRINTNGNYEPSNCRWATIQEQANNTRKNVFIEYNNEKHTISEWSSILGIKYKRLQSRILHKKPLEKCFYKGKLLENWRS